MGEEMNKNETNDCVWSPVKKGGRDGGRKTRFSSCQKQWLTSWELSYRETFEKLTERCKPEREESAISK